MDVAVLIANLYLETSADISQMTLPLKR